MRYLAGDNWYLSNYTPSMKVALSFFVLFVLLGLASSIALQYNQTQFETSKAETYYLGNQGQKNVDTFYVKKSYRELLEVAHFHLYIMPIIYLAYVHLYFLTKRSETEKVIVTIVTFLALLSEIATPWLIRFVSGDFSYLFWFSGLGITIPTIWMAMIILKALWIPSSDMN